MHAYSARLRGIAAATALLVGLWVAAQVLPEAVAAPHGFDLSNALIPPSAILSGGVPEDGIPAILDPRFVSSGQARYLRDNDVVVGFEHNGDARAYPLRILVWHEVVNDTVRGLPIAVTYCPLCGTAMVFDRRAGGAERSFGVSGLLYNSDVLLYDHQTNSLWSQLMTKSVAGPGAGTALRWLPAEQVSWKAWRKANPGGYVLSTETGFANNYSSTTPYQGYGNTGRLMFPVPTYRNELRNKEWVAGILLNGTAMAYPLAKLPAGITTDSVGGASITIDHDPASGRIRVSTEAGKPIPNVKVYWFAWQAFYPDTGLFEANTSAP